MKITGMSWQGYVLPFARDFSAHGTSAARRWGMLVFLRSENGLTGVGEASAVGTGSEAGLKAIALALNALSPVMLGKEISPDLPAPGQTLAPHIRFGIETALLDLEGQIRCCPMTVLLDRVPKPLPVNALIAAGSPEQAADEARKAVSAGFETLKIKVGQSTLDLDEEIVAAVRVASGPKVKLRLDPNQAWSTEQAIFAINRLSRFDLEYVEQPVDWRNIAGLATVRHSTSTPIAADESLTSLGDLRRLIEAEAAEVFIIKAARLGGIAPALEIAKAANAAGFRVAFTTSLESGVGIAASAHLASAMPGQGIAHGLATGMLFESDIITPTLRIERGMLATPTGPGLGVRADTGLLNQYACDVKGSAGLPPE